MEATLTVACPLMEVDCVSVLVLKLVVPLNDFVHLALDFIDLTLSHHDVLLSHAAHLAGLVHQILVALHRRLLGLQLLKDALDVDLCDFESSAHSICLLYFNLFFTR